MTRFREILAAALVGFSLAILCASLFYAQTFSGFSTDIVKHLPFVIEGARDHAWLSLHLYHLGVHCLSLGSDDAAVLGYASIALLTLAVVVKWILSYRILRRECCRQPEALAGSVFLVLCASIYNFAGHFHFLGEFRANIWHNPTAIVSAPIAILVFYAAVRCLDAWTLRAVGGLSLLLVLNSFAKPSFNLAFLPVFGWLLVSRGFSAFTGWRTRGIALALLLAPVLFLALQYLCISRAGYFGADGIGLAPFQAWALYSRNGFVSLLLSLAFPLAVGSIYFRTVRADQAVGLAWMVFAVALVEYVFVAEKGTRITHGNFSWGCHLAVYLVFLSSLAHLLKQRRDWRFALASAVLLLHVVSGVVYLAGHYVGTGCDA